jgi:hypothetical protein
MLIAYSTAEGELASDVGAGAGPYATVLAEEIVKPGAEAVNMFRDVQRRVRKAIINANGQGVARMVPLYGFEQTFRGPPVDSKIYAERIKAAIKQKQEEYRATTK